MKEAKKIKENAKNIFSPYYIYCLIIVMIFFALRGIQWGLVSYGFVAFKMAGQQLLLEFLMTVSVILGFFITTPIEVGVKRFFLKLVRDEAEMKDILFPFKKSYDRVLIVLFLRNVKIVLWSALLIVPGIYKAYEYAMVPYILVEKPSVSNREAFEISKRMMHGNRWKLFKLQLSFAGWYVLATIPLFAGFMFLSPYTQTAEALFYEEIKKNK